MRVHEQCTWTGLLMEAGLPYNQQKVHQKKYFAELLQKQKKEMPPSLPELLRLSRIDHF